MDDLNRQACVAALWILHGGSLAELLRAHDQGDHAAHLDSAIAEVSRIIGKEFGTEVWTEAMSWAFDQTWCGDASQAAPAVRN